MRSQAPQAEGAQWWRGSGGRSCRTLEGRFHLQSPWDLVMSGHWGFKRAPQGQV